MVYGTPAFLNWWVAEVFWLGFGFFFLRTTPCCQDYTLVYLKTLLLELCLACLIVLFLFLAFHFCLWKTADWVWNWCSCWWWYLETECLWVHAITRFHYPTMWMMTVCLFSFWVIYIYIWVLWKCNEKWAIFITVHFVSYSFPNHALNHTVHGNTIQNKQKKQTKKKDVVRGFIMLGPVFIASFSTQRSKAFPQGPFQFIVIINGNIKLSELSLLWKDLAGSCLFVCLSIYAWIYLQLYKNYVCVFAFLKKNYIK